MIRCNRKSGLADGKLEAELTAFTNLQPAGWAKLAIAAAVAATLVVPGQLSAQEISDGHKAAARSAITALRATDPFDAILPIAAESLKTRLISNNPDLENEISGIVDEQTLALVSRRANLENEAALIYAEVFSEEELRQIADFYATEAGQKLIQNGPAVAQEVSGAAGIWRRGIERDLLENVIAKMNEGGLRANTVGADDSGADTGTQN